MLHTSHQPDPLGGARLVVEAYSGFLSCVEGAANVLAHSQHVFHTTCLGFMYHAVPEARRLRVQKVCKDKHMHLMGLFSTSGRL